MSLQVASVRNFPGGQAPSMSTDKNLAIPSTDIERNLSKFVALLYAVTNSVAVLYLFLSFTQLVVTEQYPALFRSSQPYSLHGFINNT